MFTVETLVTSSVYTARESLKKLGSADEGRGPAEALTLLKRRDRKCPVFAR